MTEVLLLLGGTAEARAFADGFDVDGLRLIASLAGVTREPQGYACETRVGGFGGVDAMAEWLAENQAIGIVDATHPFAVQISRNARDAAMRNDVPCLGLRREPWMLGDDWQEFESATELAAALPSGSRVFLTTGRSEIKAFARRDDVSFLLRSIEKIDDLPQNVHHVLGRPPFSLDEEFAVMKQAEITHLVTKNSGGIRPAKLQAAERLDLPVFSLAMPKGPHELTALSVLDALAWSQRLR